MSKASSHASLTCGVNWSPRNSCIVVMSDLAPESIFPLLLERLNIFTDPQRPMTVTEGIYEIGNPDENSPVLVTT
ncbi:MAG: hypothetical protein P8Y36_02860, partial [Alphaproteobacteria bacterium]